MQPRVLIHAVAAAALLGSPTVALAQPAPQAQQVQQWDRSAGEQVIAQNDDRRDRDDRDDRDRDRRDRDHRHWDRDRNGSNGYNGYNNGYGNRGGQLAGTVTSFSPFNLDLSRGPHIHLHQGTIINPTGTTLQPGQRVVVYGHPNSDGTFEADQINVVGSGAGYGGYGRGGNGRYSR